MGKAFLCKSNGGGGGGLTFRVLGNPVPTSPKPNDIWVDTDEKITSYIFSATEPEGYADGMVWISTGTSSPAEFNALKKNGIQIYPISAKQHVDGAWVDVTAKSYQNGKWVDWWNGELFLYGNEFNGGTGGWVATPLYWKSSSDGSKFGTLTKTPNERGGLDLSTNNTGGVLWHTKNKIDLANVDTIKFVGSLSHTSYSALALYDKLEYLLSTVAELPGIKNYGTYNFDVSSYDQSYYVGFRVYATGKVTVDELYCE